MRKNTCLTVYILSLCKEVKVLRKKNKLSLKEIAEDIGVSPLELGQIEDGTVMISHEIAKKLKDYFERKGVLSEKIDKLNEACGDKEKLAKKRTKLTQLGLALRKARVDVGVSLRQMGDSIGLSSSFLSLVERGEKKVSKQALSKINNYFKKNGVVIDRIEELALLSNGRVLLDELSMKEKALVVKIVTSNLSDDTINNMLGVIESKKQEKSL